MIQVVIVDDQKVVTQGLKALLESEPDIQIVGTGNNGQEAVDLAAKFLPDVLLIDHYMPVMDGVQATQVITNLYPKVAVLLLSGSDQDNCIANALQAGAKGYLLKSTSAEDLANSIRSVARGYSQIGPGLLEKLLAKMGPSSSAAVPLQTLPSSLESDLLKLLSQPVEFDIDKMTRLLAAADEASVAATLMTQLEKQLQQNPHHVGALYLSGQLICKFQRHSRLAMNYLRLAFTHSQNQSFPLLASLHICRGAWGMSSDEVLGWLMGILRQWPTAQPYRTLFESVAQAFSPAAEPYRLLKAAWEIEQLNRLCEQVNALKSKLSVLNANT